MRWSAGKWAGWSIMLLLAAGVAGYALTGVIAGIEIVLPQMAYHLPERALFAILHFGVGGLVLVIGPFQFVPAIRAGWPTLHRWMGRVYVLGCVGSGMAGFVLASNTNAGPVARTGFSLLAAAWLATTIMAFIKARQRNFNEHKRWMIRSYALTLAAVTLRIYLPASMIGFGMSFAQVYPAISFACWVPNAIIAELILRKAGK